MASLSSSSYLRIFLLVFFFCYSSVQAANLPFHPRDVLPLLPKQVSWPIINYLSSAVDLLPSFVGSVSSPNNTVEWKGACFYENTAWMEFHNKSGSEFGGGTLHIKVSNAHSWTWMLGTLEALWDVFPLFTNTGWGEKSNIAFLEKHMGASFEERPQPWYTNISVDDVHSGDFLAISKIRGRWGGFETLEKWVSGAYAGHTAVCLKDSEGKLWVGESGHENEEGEDIIAVIPWDEWWEFELNKDDSDPHIAFLPLHPDIRAKFNETAAWEYALSMSGKPYGYKVVNAYESCVLRVAVASVMTVWSKIQPEYAANMWNEALNKRLGTQNLDLPEILVEVEKRGSSFDELLTIPEQDNWTYSDGKSTSCIAFVLELYKEAGLFDPISDSVQVTEFTIKDAYSLKFFENNSSRLPKWCNDADNVELPYCQILGKYRMELPGYNSMDPYPHMNERCPSMPPKYYRPENC
ncbi:hypothetical protein COLO4_09645 [Corchorus olitorius]|uniref:Uncharacterized protein n=1 Tax=Corchorus olitorius TaxID=93759 RepID=A0A1R3KBH5_9ROSI|nr:hypothetical protein COLO4_09645 [Corchorus olitorius]